jgi:SAM-dependent methyltransferase
MPDSRSLERYFQVVAEKGWKPGNLRFYLNYMFADIDFAGKSVLDVGGGDGVLSFYAACAGAARVVCLEPELAGSAAGTSVAFERMASRLNMGQVQLLPLQLQDYVSGGTGFDILLLHASINHLDEDACIRLSHDRSAQAAYRQLFGKLASLAHPGAKLIAVDCARRNLFADLHLPNPLQPTIEWHKHQSPRLWASLLGQAGFSNPVIRWNSFNTLGRFGRLLLGNAIGAYCLTSVFCLAMERPRSASVS